MTPEPQLCGPKQGGRFEGESEENTELAQFSIPKGWEHNVLWQLVILSSAEFNDFLVLTCL